MVTLDQGQWPRVICTKGNAPGSNLAQSSLTYTPSQKKGNFRKVAFLLGKSVIEKVVGTKIGAKTQAPADSMSCKGRTFALPY